MGFTVRLDDVTPLEFEGLRMLNEEREQHRAREHQMHQAIAHAPKSEF